ncbi:MAG: hypothetical protein IJE97_03655, partial [Thermoguttaceae bacterium]|nr:hypothetical protein [Thermoguttaceae bacterium]
RARDANDAIFFRRWLELTWQDEKTYRRMWADIHFAFDDEIRKWFREEWLAGEKWEYEPKRDDRSLQKILANVALRVKAPDVVERIFIDWIMPLLGSRYFFAARKLGVYPDDFILNLYDRLLGRFEQGKSSEATKGRIEEWSSENPLSLREFVEWEGLKEIWKILSRRRRAERKIYLFADLERRGKSLTKDENGDLAARQSYVLATNLQKSFERLFRKNSRDAFLIATQLSGFCLKKSAAFFKLTPDNARKRRRCASKKWLKLTEEILRVAVDDADWGEMLTEVKRASKETAKRRKKESKKEPRFGAVEPKNKNWREKYIEPIVAKTNQEDLALLKSCLASRRILETGFLWRLQLSYYTPVTQGGLGLTNTNKIKDWMVEPTWYERKTRESSAIPAFIRCAPFNQRFWKKRYPEGSGPTFYFASTAPSNSDAFWEASVRVPFDANDDAEIGVVVNCYNGRFVPDGEFQFNASTTSPIRFGVARFTIRDVREAIERGAEIAATVRVQYRVEDRDKKGRFGATFKSSGRLLYRKEV